MNNKEQIKFPLQETGKLCLAVRAKHHLSQVALARFIGIHEATVCRFEKGNESNHSIFVFHMLKQMLEANALPNADFIFPWKLESDRGTH